MSVAKGQEIRQYWANPWVRRFFWVALAVAFYGLSLGLAIPKLVKYKAPDQFAKTFHGQLSFDDISFNPFTWELNLSNLAIEDEAQQPALGFGHLYLNLSPLDSLLNREWQVQGLKLQAPQVRMVGENIADNNLSDLFKPRNPSPEPATSEPSGMPALVVEQLDVIDGWIHLERINGNAVAFSDWDLSSPRLALLGEDNVIDIQLEAEQGGLFHLVTHVAFEPFKLDLDLDIKELALVQYWPFVAELVDFQFDKGQLDGKLHLTVTAEHGTVLDPSQLVLSDIGFSREESPLFAIEAIKLDGLGVDVRNKQLTLASLYIQQPELFGNLTDQGLDWQTLMVAGAESTGEQPDQQAEDSKPVQEQDSAEANPEAEMDMVTEGEPSPDAEASEEAPAEQIVEQGPAQEKEQGTDEGGESNVEAAELDVESASEGGWGVALSQFVLEEGLVALTDQRLQTPQDWHLLLTRTEVKDFTWPSANPMSLLVDAELKDVVTLGLEGQWDLASSSGELNVAAEEMDLTSTIPYWQQDIPLELVSGWVSVQGLVTANLNAEPVSVQFDGEASSRELLIKDQRIGEDLLAWQGVSAKPIRVDTAARSLSIEKLDLQQAFARIVIAEDGDTNLSDLAGGEGETAPIQQGEQTAADDEIAAEEVSGTSEPIEPWQMKLDTIQFTDSAAFFADNSLTPKFATGIEAINGTILGLNSSSEAKAKVDINGSVDKYAPVSLKGEVQPLAATPSLDLSLSFENLELTSLNSYSGTYAGYYIEQGLLNLDLSYALENNKLQGSNRVVMDQLTLGQRSNSDKATSLPVALAVALMKDSNGVIDLGLDVSGDLDDPEFAIGPLIGKALINVITKVVTSPFSLLASLVPDGEAPQEILFTPGNAELAEAQQKSLVNLIEGLNQRPGLALALQGAVDPESDGDILKRQRITERLQLDGNDDLGRLKPAYELEFGTGSAEALVADKDAAVASKALLEALVSKETIPESALAELAAQRATVVKGALIESGLSAERVFLKESRIQLDSSGRKVVLSLDARS